MTLKEIVTLPYPAKISHAIAGVLYYQIIAGNKTIVFPIDLGDLEVRDCEYSDDEITLLEE